MAVELAPELLEILACPNCHGALAVDHERDELVCLDADCGLAYPVRNGIPVLLIDEARRPNTFNTDTGTTGTPDRSGDATTPRPADAPASTDES
jgi:uncharacterized protein YbaR (Trm112 family)